MAIEEYLEMNQSLISNDPFLERYSGEPRLLRIEIILEIERAYLFLSDLKHYCDNAEQSDFFERVKQTWEELKWPASIETRLTTYFAKGAKDPFFIP